VLNNFETAEVIKVEFSETTFVMLSYFNYFCMICSKQTSKSLYILPINLTYNCISRALMFHQCFSHTESSNVTHFMCASTHRDIERFRNDMK